MIVNEGNPPQTTFADINPGVAYTNGVGDRLAKTDQAGTAYNLVTGQLVTGIPDSDVIEAHPNATVTLYP